MKITFEHNYFENITNSVTEAPIISLKAGEVIFRNNTIKNSEVSSVLFLTALSGVIEDNFIMNTNGICKLHTPLLLLLLTSFIS